MSDTTNTTKCELCGADPALGWAWIGDKRYCHGEHQRVSCYVQAQNQPGNSRFLAGATAGIEEELATLTAQRDEALAQLAAMTERVHRIEAFDAYHADMWGKAEVRADSLERIVRVLAAQRLGGSGVTDAGIRLTDFVRSDEFAPGDFDLLRSLITPEGGE